MGFQESLDPRQDFKMRSLLFVLALGLACGLSSALKKGECEVCEKTIERFAATLTNLPNPRKSKRSSGFSARILKEERTDSAISWVGPKMQPQEFLERCRSLYRGECLHSRSVKSSRRRIDRFANWHTRNRSTSRTWT